MDQKVAHEGLAPPLDDPSTTLLTLTPDVASSLNPSVDPLAAWGTHMKRSWSVEEDDKVRAHVKAHGTSKWTTVANALGGRGGKQCRERWHNHLDPEVKKGGWTAEEG